VYIEVINYLISPKKVEQWSKKGGDMRLVKKLEATRVGDFF
jgi:hypothetical protein